MIRRRLGWAATALAMLAAAATPNASATVIGGPVHTGVELRGRTLTVTVAADPAACLGATLPGEPVDAPWTAAVDADVSYITPNARWARAQTKAAIRAQLDPVFGDDAHVRCRQTRQSRFSCSFGSFAGDTVIAGDGRLWIDRDDESASYSFRVRQLDEYCRYVQHKPLRRCYRVSRWRM